MNKIKQDLAPDTTDKRLTLWLRGACSEEVMLEITALQSKTASVSGFNTPENKSVISITGTHFGKLPLQVMQLLIVAEMTCGRLSLEFTYNKALGTATQQMAERLGLKYQIHESEKVSLKYSYNIPTRVKTPEGQRDFIYAWKVNIYTIDETRSYRYMGLRVVDRCDVYHAGHAPISLSNFKKAIKAAEKETDWIERVYGNSQAQSAAK